MLGRILDWILELLDAPAPEGPPPPAPRATPPPVPKRVAIPVEVEWEPDSHAQPPLELRPWDVGSVAPSLATEDIVGSLVDALEWERERGDGQGEQAFVDRLLETVRRGEMDLPAFPDVARGLDELLAKGIEPTMVQVVRLVERDPALVQRVWTRASSAEFAAPPKGLHYAISRVGFDELWRIAIQVCLQSQLFKVPGFQAKADQVRMFGMATADVAAELGGERRGAAYMAGLLHDVGRLIVYRHAHPQLATSPRSAGMVERLANDLHASLGVLVARAWNLGDEVAAGLAFHHDPECAPAQVKRIARVVRVATIAVHAADATQRGVQTDPKPAMLQAAQGLHHDQVLGLAQRSLAAASKASK